MHPPRSECVLALGLVSLERDKYFLWRDLFLEKQGILMYGENGIARFLQGEFRTYLATIALFKSDARKLAKIVPPCEVKICV